MNTNMPRRRPLPWYARVALIAVCMVMAYIAMVALVAGLDLLNHVVGW